MAGKGDGPRPYSVSVDEYVKRWDATFGTTHETRPTTCDRCNGTGILWDTDIERPTVQTSRVCPSCLGSTPMENK